MRNSAVGSSGMRAAWALPVRMKRAMPYEMWSFTNARLWSEGLKIELKKLGYTYDPEQLQVISCGVPKIEGRIRFTDENRRCLVDAALTMGRN